MTSGDADEFTFSLLPREPTSASPPGTPTLRASPLLSPPTTRVPRRAGTWYRKLRPQGRASRSPKPKWYVLLIGSVKTPPEMEMEDIKTRQMRRIRSACGDRASGATGAAGAGGGNAPWRLLHSLSCRAGVDVVAQCPARLFV